MMQQDLATIVRHKIAAGALPTDLAPMMAVGYGNRRACDVCNEPIIGSEVAYEPSFADRRTLCLHHECLLMWRRARSQTM